METGATGGTMASAAVGTGEGIPAKNAGSGAGMPARTVGSRTFDGLTCGNGNVEGVNEESGSGVGDDAIISVGVSERLGDVAAIASCEDATSSALVPKIGTPGCKG